MAVNLEDAAAPEESAKRGNCPPSSGRGAVAAMQDRDETARQPAPSLC